MPSHIDITGQTFNRLTVKKYMGKSKVLCVCTCGNEIITQSRHLKSNHTKSCGCIRSKHGMHNTDTYHAWENMIRRCSQNDKKSRKTYFMRGITVCEEWKLFVNFFKDMGVKPSKELSLDRINNDLGYCKDNCKWSTRKEQQNNMSSNRILDIFGVRKNTSQWASFSGVPAHIIRSRIDKNGWSPHDAVSTPVGVKPSRNI